MNRNLGGIIAIGLVSALAVSTAPAQQSPAGVLAGKKIAILVVQEAIGGQGSGRFYTAVKFAKQFKKAGAEVQMLFEGGGVQWLSLRDAEEVVPPDKDGKLPTKGPRWGPHLTHIQRAEEKLGELKAAGIAVRASASASQHFKMKDKLKGQNVRHFDDVGAPDELPQLIAQGYQILVF